MSHNLLPYIKRQYNAGQVGTAILRGGPASAGTGVLAGATGMARRVLLFNQGFRCIEETWSDSVGTFQFSYLADAYYYLVALDHIGVYEATISGPRRPTL